MVSQGFPCYGIFKFLCEDEEPLPGSPAQTAKSPTGLTTQLILCTTVGVVCFLLFCFLRPRWKNIYSPRLRMKKHAPEELPTSLFGWIIPLLKIDNTVMMEKVGLDAVVMLQFLLMSVKLFSFCGFFGTVVLYPISRMGGDFANGTHPNSTQSLESPETRSMSYLWVYLFFTYMFVLATFYFTFLNYKDYVRIRREFLLRKIKSISSRTLLVTGIPPQLRSDRKLAEYFEQLGIGVVESVHTIRHVNRLLETLKERTQYLRKLETAYAAHLGNPRLDSHRDRPQVSQTWCGPAQDAIHLYTDKFEKADGLVIKARKKGKFQATSVGFVTFEETISAYIASQVLISPTPFQIRTQLAPEPRDVLWENIAMHARERWLRKTLVAFVLLFLVFSWTIPCNYLSALTSTKSLKAYFPWLLRLAEKNKILNQIVAGFIPTLGVVIFFSVLPLIFNSLSVIEGFPTRSQAEESCFAKQFFFLFFNVLLFITVASSLFKSQKDIFEDPTKIANIFASKLPEVAPFYMNYIVLQGIMLCPIQLLQIGPILVQQFYRLFLCKTPRDFAEIYAPRMYNFGWGYPIPVFVFVVVLVYSIISPLILVFGVIYFAMSYVVCKYQLTYVFFHSYEVAGRMWPLVFSRIIVALIMFELTSAGLFTLNKAFTMAGLCVPLLIATVGYKVMMDKSYHASTLPLQLLAEKLGPVTTSAPQTSEESDSRSRDTTTAYRRIAVLDEDDYVARPRSATDFREPPMTLLDGILNTGMRQYGHPALLGKLPQLWLPVQTSTHSVRQDEESAKGTEQQPLLANKDQFSVGTYYHHPERLSQYGATRE